MSALLLTIGHSTRSMEEFVHLLKVHGVNEVIDVRSVPRSRRNPQFNRDSLPGSLDAVEVAYLHVPGLGGLRHPKTDSQNLGWHHPAFRGFADYMQTTEFAASLAAVTELAKQNTLALMCAEAVPWRCHRSLIADALIVRGYEVEHILSANKRLRHELTPWAKVDGTRITYPETGSSSE